MLESISNFLTLNNILMMNIGVAVGILIGAAPGLSVSFAVTILLTMTFHMDSLAAMFLLLGAYCGGMFGGSITAMLINTPGTANAVCTAISAFAQRTRGRRAQVRAGRFDAGRAGQLRGAFLPCAADRQPDRKRVLDGIFRAVLLRHFRVHRSGGNRPEQAVQGLHFRAITCSPASR